MSCARVRKMLDAWMDGELDAATSTAIASHLAACPDCLARKAEREQLRTLVQVAAPRYKASVTLRESVIRTAKEGARKRPTRNTIARPSWWQTFGLALAAGAVSAATTLLFVRMPADDRTNVPLQEQLAERHVISLARANIVDVASADRHVIRPWFQGRIDFSPAVRDLSAQGFVLRGARLDNLAGQQSVAVVYQLRDHPINLFVWRNRADQPERGESVVVSHARGFSIASWHKGGLSFAAISDVESGEIERFAREMEKSVEP